MKSLYFTPTQMQHRSFFGNPSLPHLSFPFQFPGGDLVIYQNRMTVNTVNLNTVNMDTVNANMNMNMNTTNNVELQQRGGVAVVGDNANINNYHHPPQD